MIRTSSLSFVAAALVTLALLEDYEHLRSYMLKGSLLRQAQPRAVESIKERDEHLAAQVSLWFTRYKRLVDDRNRIVHSVGVANLDDPIKEPGCWHPRKQDIRAVTVEELEQLLHEANHLAPLGYKLAGDVEELYTGQRTLD